jgi:hypothetical protein
MLVPVLRDGRRADAFLHTRFKQFNDASHLRITLRSAKYIAFDADSSLG